MNNRSYSGLPGCCFYNYEENEEQTAVDKDFYHDGLGFKKVIEKDGSGRLGFHQMKSPYSWRRFTQWPLHSTDL